MECLIHALAESQAMEVLHLYSVYYDELATRTLLELTKRASDESLAEEVLLLLKVYGSHTASGSSSLQK
jgi:hypothetical protein